MLAGVKTPCRTLTAWIIGPKKTSLVELEAACWQFYGVREGPTGSRLFSLFLHASDWNAPRSTAPQDGTGVPRKSLIEWRMVLPVFEAGEPGSKRYPVTVCRPTPAAS